MGEVDNFSILSLSIHKYGILFHYLRFHSFLSIMFCCFQFRGLICVLIGNYFMSYANIKSIIIKFYFGCLFLAYKYTGEFCVLTLYPETLLNSPFNFNSLWVFHVLNYMVYKLWWFYVFLFNFYDISLWVFFFFCLFLLPILLPGTSNTMSYYCSQEKRF